MFQCESYTAFGIGLWVVNCVRWCMPYQNWFWLNGEVIAFLCVHFINKWIEASFHWLFLDTRLNVYVECGSIHEMKGIDFNAFRFHYITFIFPIADHIGNIWWSSRIRLKINIYFYLHCTHWNGLNRNITSRIWIHLSFRSKSPTFQSHAHRNTEHFIWL